MPGTDPSGPVPNKNWTLLTVLPVVTPEMFNRKVPDPITLGLWPVIDGFALLYNPLPFNKPLSSGPMIILNGLPPSANGPAVSSVYVPALPPTPQWANGVVGEGEYAPPAAILEVFPELPPSAAPLSSSVRAYPVPAGKEPAA